ncbi:DUF2877 domain-containing protein [Sporosarcina sp. Marseille-Q4943]|uniref:DUF2877 domain-containing protein n=1 Tax=Sporosarcina sp. Marseille-Q4943 TaxID=2942204 RepID=UPI00208DBF57|nr:DUF2877 domain-containing protein [Sporosarcina sp. Marseille-Q4943]
MSDRNSRAFVLTALAASEDISRILEENPKGHVHSVFNTSFNLAFGEHLVHIGALENGLAPFGIGMDQANATLLTKLLAVDLEVVWDETSMSLLFPKGITLSMSQVKWTNHKLQPFSYDLLHLESNFRFIAERILQADWQTGLAQTEEEKKRIIQYIVDPSSSVDEIPVLDKLDCLRTLVCHHEQDAEKVFDYWIGRGLGLTPSGDDCITGICAVLSALDGVDQTFLGKLNSYLEERGRKRTTYVALEYLLYATENKFHSHLLQLCYVLDKPRGPEFLKALEEMKEIGHTSGADTLVGMLIGMKAAVIH